MHGTTSYKSLPSSTETERCVLGSILIDERLIASVADELTPDDFYSSGYRRVFTAMLELFKAKRTIDPIHIGEIMKRENALELFGGISAITNLSFGLPMVSIQDSESVRRQVLLLKQKRQVRDLIKTCDQILTEAVSESTDASEILSTAQSAINDVCTSQQKQGLALVSEISVSVVNKAIALRNNEIEADGLMTGFRHLDFITRGFQRSDFVVIAGRPAMGKSALLGQVCKNACTVDPNAVIAIFSLEMSKEQYVQRLVASHAGVDLTKLRAGSLSSDEVERMKHASVFLHGLNLHIDDSSSISALEIRAKLLRLQHERGRVDAVAIDFLQRMRTDKRTDSRQQEVSRIAQDLKTLAKDFQIPVIALSSLSRACELRNPPKPRMSDLRESGDIESEADLVGFVYRPHKYDGGADPLLAEFIIDKHRHGPTGVVKLNFLGEYTRFSDY